MRGSVDNLPHVGVYAIVLNQDEQELRGLTDPAGGTFDAAGDFDRLLDRVPSAVTLSTVDPYGDTSLSRGDAAALLQELPAVFEQAQDGPERRGVARLAVLAALCESDDSLTLRFIGD